MSVVTITSIKVQNNPCAMVDPFRFEITFDASQQLEDDLEWRLTYVGSADSEQYDQVLDSVLVGPVPCGVNRFELEAPGPDVSKIPHSDLLGVTVVLLECLYRDKIFVRVGYYVNNDDPNAVVVPVAAQLLPEAQGNDDGTAAAAAAGEEVLGDEEEDDDDEEDEEEDEEDDDEPAAAPGAPATIPAAGDAKRQKVEAAPAVAVVPVVVVPPPKEIRRTILEDAPRITRFAIDWDASSS